MYGTTASCLYRNLGSEGWPHHFQNQDINTLERHFVLEYAKTSLYEWQKYLGMLSPHAQIYHHPTDNLSRECYATDKDDNIHYKEKHKDSIEEKDKENRKDTHVEAKNQSITNTEECTSSIKDKQNEWKKVKPSKKKHNTKQIIQVAEETNKKTNNTYSALEDEEDEAETKIEKKIKMVVGRESIDNEKNNDEDYKDKYNVNNIPMDVLDKILKDNEHKEKESQSEEHNKVHVNDKMNNDKKEDGDKRVKMCSDYDEEESVDIEEIADASAKIKAMKEEIETLRYQYLANLQQLEEYEETDETLRKKLHELETGQNEVIKKEEEINGLDNKITRLGKMETRQEEKEAEWIKRIKEYEDKLAIVDLVLADYDLRLEWEEGEVKVYDSMRDEEDEMYESDDLLCDDLVDED